MKDKNIKISNNKDAKLPTSRVLALVVGGIVVGFISGLFGGGGGIIIVPLLSSVALLKEKQAHATSIAIIFPIAIICSIVYFLSGTRVEWQSGLYIAIGVFAGGLIGTFLLKKLSSNALRILFYIIMMVAGVKMLI